MDEIMNNIQCKVKTEWIDLKKNAAINRYTLDSMCGKYAIVISDIVADNELDICTSDLLSIIDIRFRKNKYKNLHIRNMLERIIDLHPNFGNLLIKNIDTMVELCDGEYLHMKKGDFINNILPEFIIEE